LPGCPLPIEALSPALQKHVAAGAPVPLRMMGAKGLVPAVAPGDLVTLLYFLSFDVDPSVQETAARSAAALPERIWSTALRSEAVEGPVLDWLADRLVSSPGALQAILLNQATSDETVARLAPVVPAPLLEIIRQNELRLLRHDDIVPPSTAPATSASATGSCSSTSRSSSRPTAASTAPIPRPCPARTRPRP
jgi:hypothetical protein